MGRNPISFDMDENLKLPVGYIFDPTDEVLVNYYLKKAVFDKTPDTEIIPAYDVFQMEPWRLPGGGKFYKGQKFFFCPVIEISGTKAAGTGQWMIMERGKEIVTPANRLTIGKRDTLIFCDGQGNQTNWFMHEFRLASRTDPLKMSRLAVYRIFQKKEARKVKKAKGWEDLQPTVIDFTVESGNTSGPPSPSSP